MAMIFFLRKKKENLPGYNNIAHIAKHIQCNLENPRL